MRIETGSPIDPSLFGFPSEPGFLPVRAIATDSREIRPGDLFIALMGEKTDGAAYIDEAFSRGAALVLSHKSYGDRRVLSVPDPLAALTGAAKRYAESIQHKTVAITGSYGKTTLRHALTSILSPILPIAYTEGNGNTDPALALTLLKMKRGTSILIAELGMRGRGEIGRLSRLIRPELSVVTAIGSAHVGRLGSIGEIREAKCEIVEGMTPDGLLLYPANDTDLEKRILRLPVRRKSVSTEREIPGDYTLKKAGENDGRALVSLSSQGGANTCVLLPDSSAATLGSAAFAFAVCEELGIDREITREGLSQLEPPPLRRKTETVRGVTLILDCYNASPEPTLAALSDLRRFVKESKRIFLVLGEMLELGAESEKWHVAVGRRAAGLHPERLFTVGRSADGFAVGATEAGLPPEKTRAFSQNEPEELALLLRAETRPGDVIFIKGSRALALERLVPFFKKADV